MEIQQPPITGNLALDTWLQRLVEQLSNVLPYIDEDDMSSDSENHVPTQQSVKAYVDAL